MREKDWKFPVRLKSDKFTSNSTCLLQEKENGREKKDVRRDNEKEREEKSRKEKE